LVSWSTWVSHLILVSLITEGFDPCNARVDAYIPREGSSSSDDSSFRYYSVVNTVREAGEIPFKIFANRISGDRVTFIVALIGYPFYYSRIGLCYSLSPL